MSAAQHTPGPWEAVDSMTVRGPYAMGDHSKPGLLVASLPAYTQQEERAANARLIAAAPKLLAALEDLVSAAENLTPCEHEQEGESDLAVAVVNARDVIAKVTGNAS